MSDEQSKQETPGEPEVEGHYRNKRTEEPDTAAAATDDEPDVEGHARIHAKVKKTTH